MFKKSLKAIKDNTALKPSFDKSKNAISLKAIKDNTALKPQVRLKARLIFS